jgi:hypothetical protein
MTLEEVGVHVKYIAKTVDEIKEGLWGNEGLEPRLRRVEQAQARQKGVMAVLAGIGTFIGGLTTWLFRWWTNK